MPTPAHTNRLALEKSPYLLQHARNPVDWYPWGDEAFARARSLDAPVFLSIGYSTCHWCHVMERESFENAGVAELLNAHFVCIKVDREERPDVDRLYMTALRIMGVGGGWPLTALLTPDGRPFWGGTYFPPSPRGGMPGLDDLLPRLHAAWLEQREAIEAGGARVIAALATQRPPEAAAVPFEALALECDAALAAVHDTAGGGFGTAPKFPSPGNLNYLVRRYARDASRHAEALAMLRSQLDAMQAGGIHDHLGGGFHRYATDRHWRVPHFEKMLYDQALLADAYLDGYQVTGDEAYARTARGIFAYVLRDLTSPDGAFYSAEDADAGGEEGRFHAWTLAQLREVLGEADAALFSHAYGVTQAGNFEHGASVLHAAHTPEHAAEKFALPVAEAAARLARARARLLEVRESRVRPHRDDKVITAWNGLMIAALAHGACVLGEPALGAAAARAATFVWERLRAPGDGALLRRWCDGEAALAGQLDDHACFVRGLLELHAATHDAAWLERAVRLTDLQVERFWDDADGAFFESPAGDPLVAVRMKDGFDGAELAGNSVAAGNLVRLVALTGRDDWQVLLDRTLGYHARRLAAHASAMPQMLVAMDRAAHPGRHIVIAGEATAARAALLAVHGREFRPFDDLVVVNAASRTALASLAPFTASLQPLEGRPTAFVCVDHACRLPVTEPEAFAAQLDEPAALDAGGETR